MMIDRIQGNQSLKQSLRLQLAGRRLSHSLLLVGEQGLGTGFAARCVAADSSLPGWRPPCPGHGAGQCCRAVGKPGDRSSGRIETGIVREAVSVEGMGAGGRYLVSQVQAMRARSSTPAFPPRGGRCCSTMWSG